MGTEDVIISIIIPAKNEEINIKRCLESVFGIDYPHQRYEVIVVDNGSTDSTVSIAVSAGATVFRKPGLKISALRNFGVHMAHGNILAFLDADCTVSKDWLRNAEKYFFSEKIVCFGSSPCIPAQPTWVQETWFKVRQKRMIVTETSWLESMNMFVRRMPFEKIGGFDETLTTCEDVDLSYRLAKYGKIVSDQRIVAIHHGEARDLLTFFKKERWRGKSNYRGMIQHGLRMDELPSLVLPIYFLFFLLLFFIFLAASKFSFAAATGISWQLPILGITYRQIHTQLNFGSFFRLLALYNVYYLARSLAIF